MSLAGDEPISYLALEPGTPVISADGETVGEVAHVLADPEHDIFEGIVVQATWLPGGHVFADASQVEEIRSEAASLKLSAEHCRSLPQPSANPAAIETTPDDTVAGGMGEEVRDKLRRAWDLISGNY